MRHIIMTPATIEEMCEKLREQLNGAYVGKDNYTVTVPTKLEIADSDKPTIIVSTEADRKISALVEQCKDEIAWNGTVTYDEDSNTYYIEDIFVFPQEVTRSTATATDDYGLWLSQFSDEEFSKLRFHGHSHVNMGVSPSGVDTTFQEDLINTVQDFYIFAIYNKKGDYNVWIYNKVKNLVYETKDIYYDSEATEVIVWADEMIKNFVKTKTYVAAVTTKDKDKDKDQTPVIKGQRTYFKGSVWSSKHNGYVDPSVLNDGNEKKPPTDKRTSAYKEYQKEQLKKIEARKTQGMVCDGQCAVCEDLQCIRANYSLYY